MPPPPLLVKRFNYARFNYLRCFCSLESMTVDDVFRDYIKMTLRYDEIERTNIRRAIRTTKVNATLSNRMATLNWKSLCRSRYGLVWLKNVASSVWNIYSCWQWLRRARDSAFASWLLTLVSGLVWSGGWLLVVMWCDWLVVVVLCDTMIVDVWLMCVRLIVLLRIPSLSCEKNENKYIYIFVALRRSTECATHAITEHSHRNWILKESSMFVVILGLWNE